MIGISIISHLLFSSLSILMKRRLVRKNQKTTRRKIYDTQSLENDTAEDADYIDTTDEDSIEEIGYETVTIQKKGIINGHGHMNDDPIDAYSSHEEGLQEWTDEENILDRLDDWNPHPKYEETIDNDDIYPINSDTDTRDSCSIHSGIAEYKESTTVNRQQDDHDMHMPCFSLDSVRKNTHTQYKENGLADRALKTMLQEFDSYNQWDRRVNAEMATMGSIVMLCSQNEDACLLKMISPWMEQGLIFAWCIQFKGHKLHQLIESHISVSTANIQTDDIIEEFSQPPAIPDYEPQEDDDRILVAFSFAYMNTNARTSFFKQEKWVAIWPPWIEMKMQLPGEEEETALNLVTRFKADTLY